jgi:hypothetical protein
MAHETSPIVIICVIPHFAGKQKGSWESTYTNSLATCQGDAEMSMKEGCSASRNFHWWTKSEST